MTMNARYGLRLLFGLLLAELPVLAGGSWAAPDLPPGASTEWWNKVRHSILLEEYAVEGEDSATSGYRAVNRAHRFESRFDTDGLKLAPIDGSPWELGLTLKEWGRPEVPCQAGAGLLAADGNRVELGRNTLTEWFVNSPDGLEHGFTVPVPPEQPGNRLVFDLVLTGGLRPVFAGDGQAIDFYGSGSVSVLRYAKLVVTDAVGTVLPAHMQPVDGGIRIVVDDSGAIYPVVVDPLATSPAWTLTGESPLDNLGISVSTAGDVNGDGYSDVVVGADGNDDGGDAAGKAYLYLGGPAGLSTFPAWSALGEAAGDFLGGDVATAGDVNGDGYSDVLVTSSASDGGREVHLYLGAASGLSADPWWTASGETADEGFGNVLGTAGDVNGDGYSDVIIGASYNDDNGIEAGKVYLYLGRYDGLSPGPSWTALGEHWDDHFGSEATTAGDVNGDGYSDVVIGAPGNDDNGTRTGKVYVFLGGPAGLAASASWTAVGEAESDSFGGGAATAGDVNGDGYSDVIIGAGGSDEGAWAAGKTYLYLGGPAGLAANPSWSALGELEYDGFGELLGPAGDVNGDGYADILVGVTHNDENGMSAGKAYLYLGNAGGLSASPSWTALGENESDYFTRSISTAGDVNGDGCSDVIIGANGYGDVQGRAYLYLGGPSGPAAAASWTAPGEAANDYFGYSVSTAGDVNGDGYSDVLVGAYYNDDNGSNAGKAYLYLGGPSGLPAAASWTALGEAAHDYFGNSLATAGDVNGDGYSDVLVGARLNDENGYNAGKVYLYSGGSSGLAAAASWTAMGEAGPDEFGVSVGTAGDVNGDGYSDVLVGAYYNDENGSNAGKAYLYSGGGGNGVPVVPRQLRAEEPVPIHTGGTAYQQQFRLGLRMRSPAGRAAGKLQWQVAPWSGSFLPSLNPVQTGTVWHDTSAAATHQVDLSVDGQRYVWRARVLYHPARSPFVPWSPWFTLSGNALHEADLVSRSQPPPPPCLTPAGETYITTITVDGNNKPVIHYQDPNQPDARTGYNIYRASSPTGPWVMLGSNVVDMDEGTPDNQYVDQTGDVGGPWYYQTAAWNEICGAEGPW